MDNQKNSSAAHSKDDPDNVLGCWTGWWHSKGLCFATLEAERAFQQDQLNNDEHYAKSKWVFVFLAAAYLAYAITVTATHCVNESLPGLVLRASLLPVLYFILFGGAAVFAWWRKGRRYANHLLWVVLLVQAVAFIMVPAMTPPNWFSIERQVSDVAGYASYYPYDNSTFRDGILIGPGLCLLLLLSCGNGNISMAMSNALWFACVCVCGWWCCCFIINFATVNDQIGCCHTCVLRLRRCKRLLLGPCG